MSQWKMCSKRYDDGVCECMMDIHTIDATGAMSGTVTFMNKAYSITGSWAASGSVPGRNASAFAFYGSNSDEATEYISAVGTMTGPGRAPEEISMNLNRSDSGDGNQFGWSGLLHPDTEE
jgi:hypothetical protein